MTTALHYNTRYATHTISGHPEHAGRLEAVANRLKENGFFSDADVLQLDSRLATIDELLLVHSRTHLDLLTRTSELDGPARLDGDTYVVPESYELARHAIGAMLNAVDVVQAGDATNALVCARPPGHHATPDRAMGFCLLSTIAIAARYAVSAHQLERVAIIDFDVHHGNGTQDALYDDPTILFISSHLYPFYPGTGAIHETGHGKGRGLTINIPIVAQTGDAGIQKLYETIVLPALQRFQPQLLLVSAGFDAHWRDPLANLNLSLSGYADLCTLLKQAADSLCEGRVIALTEGGYDLEVLSYGVTNLLRIWLDRANEVEDPIGAKQIDQPVDELVNRIKSIHNL